MATMILISALLAIAPAAETAAPAASEPDVWALVSRVDSVPAYEVYLDRFPKGPHREAAVEAYNRLQGRPVLYAPPPPTPPLPAPVVAIVPPPPDPCSALLLRPPLKEGDADEARAFNDAQRSNRPADFQAYLAGYPSGACRARATRILTARETRALRFKRVPGLGPLAPHRLIPSIFDDEDYPAAALRAGEAGIVAAEWDVAKDGVVESCRVVRSSGSAVLDKTTCRLITTRLRYDPARDAAGAVTRTVDQMSIGWTLPAE